MERRTHPFVIRRRRSANLGFVACSCSMRHWGGTWVLGPGSCPMESRSRPEVGLVAARCGPEVCFCFGSDWERVEAAIKTAVLIERRTPPSVIVGLDPTIQGQGAELLDAVLGWYLSFGSGSCPMGPKGCFCFGLYLGPESRKPKMQQTTTPFSLSDKLQSVLCFASFFGLLLKIPPLNLLRRRGL
jgi:hypothetical protein